MTAAKKIEAAMNAIAAMGKEWTIELQDEVERQVRTSDAKDSAKVIAKRAVSAVYA